MRQSALATLMMILTGCGISPQGPGPLNRLEAPARAHASALAADDVTAMRATGRTLLAQLKALANW